MHSRLRAMPLIILALITLVSPAHAALHLWDGGGGDDSMATANNWATNTPPSGGGNHLLQFIGPNAGVVADGSSLIVRSDGKVDLNGPISSACLEQRGSRRPVNRPVDTASPEHGSGMRCRESGLPSPRRQSQSGRARLEDVIVWQGGFTQVRRATETPFNMVLEARN